MGRKLAIEEMLQCGSYQYKPGKEFSAALKRLKEAMSNMPNSAKASSTGVGLWDKVQATPTIAETVLQQFEARQQDNQADKQSDPVCTSVRTQDVITSFLLHKKHEGVGDETQKTYEKRLLRFAR